jgi:hypothetical protein
MLLSSRLGRLMPGGHLEAFIAAAVSQARQVSEELDSSFRGHACTTRQRHELEA